MGTLIWKSLNLCFLTYSKKSKGRDQSKRSFLSLGQVLHILHKSGVWVMQFPQEELDPAPIWYSMVLLCPRSFLWRGRVFSNGGALSKISEKNKLSFNKELSIYV